MRPVTPQTQCRVEKGQARATILFWDGHSHETGIAQFGDIVPGIALGPVDLGGVWRNLAVCEIVSLFNKFLLCSGKR